VPSLITSVSSEAGRSKTARASVPEPLATEVALFLGLVQKVQHHGRQRLGLGIGGEAALAVLSWGASGGEGFVISNFPGRVLGEQEGV